MILDLDGVSALVGGRYDDGRAYVPGGIAMPVEGDVVVGAGLAGLTGCLIWRHSVSGLSLSATSFIAGHD